MKPLHLTNLHIAVDDAVGPDTTYVLLILREDGTSHIVDMFAAGDPDEMTAILDHATALKDRIPNALEVAAA